MRLRSCSSVRRSRQAFAFTAIAIATAVRLQGAVLVGVLVTALLLVVIFDLRATRPDARAGFTSERLRPYWPTAAAFAAVGVAFVALEAVRGEWAYEEVARAEYSARDAWGMTRVHLAALALTSGIVPLSALILLSWRAFTGATRTARASVPCGSTAAAVVRILPGRPVHLAFPLGLLGERYVFYVIPLLFLALAVWLAQGFPRPRITTAIAANGAGRDRGFRARDARCRNRSTSGCSRSTASRAVSAGTSTSSSGSSAQGRVSRPWHSGCCRARSPA